MPISSRVLDEMLNGLHGTEKLDIARAYLEAQIHIDDLKPKYESAIIQSTRHQEAMEQLIAERADLQEKLAASNVEHQKYKTAYDKVQAALKGEG